jgi:Mg-chelatase subunit ChlI
MTFPFSALVGQDDMKQAIPASAIDPTIGGALAAAACASAHDNQHPGLP